jgi:hypothetical protein
VKILILKSERLAADSLLQVAMRVVPDAAIRRESSVSSAQRAIEAVPADVVISGITASDGDTLEFLAGCVEWSGSAEAHLYRHGHRVGCWREPAEYRRLSLHQRERCRRKLRLGGWPV